MFASVHIYAGLSGCCLGNAVIYLPVLSLPTDAPSGGVLLHSEEGIFRKYNQCNITLRANVVFKNGGYCTRRKTKSQKTQPN